MVWFVSEVYNDSSEFTSFQSMRDKNSTGALTPLYSLLLEYITCFLHLSHDIRDVKRWKKNVLRCFLLLGFPHPLLLFSGFYDMLNFGVSLLHLFIQHAVCLEPQVLSFTGFLMYNKDDTSIHIYFVFPCHDLLCGSLSKCHRNAMTQNHEAISGIQKCKQSRKRDKHTLWSC